MAEYIDIDKAVLVADIRGRELKTTVRHILGMNKGIYDTDDVQPVRHGRWIDKPGGTYRRMQSWCSVCGKRNGIGGIESNRHKPYCPNCGAKMDAEAQE